MPKLFEWKGYRFFFFSNEGIPLEPCHIHVRKGNSLAKYWVSISNVSLESSYEMSAQELKALEKVIMEHRELTMEKYNEYFNA